MQKTDSLIRTKLRPPFTRLELVPRPRLQSQVIAGLRGPLTLITAPAGFGKTTLTASCVAGCDIPTAWLSLDKDDNQVVRFLNYLIAALHEVDNRIGNDAVLLMAEVQQLPLEVILTGLVNDLDAIAREIILVLDDYQFISDPAIHTQVTFLLEHCPNTFHLVIASRSDPPLPLSRLRARGQMVELRAADLRFTQSEALQFLNDVMGLQLDNSAVTALEARTEGWIAGLQMAALSMRGRKDVTSFIREFAGTHRFIMDYLLEEVLALEPAAVQDFLLQTAILDRLTGALCDAVTGSTGGQEMLERLEQRNLFVVSLDDERRWYRYHHLFADLMRARLQQTGAESVAQLRSRAAEWCWQEGQITGAVNYALAAQDYQRAAPWIARYWHRAISKGEIETVWSWLKALPEDTIKNSALLGLAYCWVLWSRGQIGAIEPHLVDAENALNKLIVAGEFNVDNPAYADLPVHLAILRSIISRYSNDFEAAVAFAERALRLAPENLPLKADAQLRALISFALASAYDGSGDLERAVGAYTEHIRLSYITASVAGISVVIRLVGALRLLGRLREADAACRDALAYVQAQGLSRLPAAGLLHVAMSEVLVERNNLEAAEVHLAQGFELGKWSGRFDAVRNAAPALSRIRVARCDVDGALVAIQEAESSLGEPPSPLAKAELLALKAQVLVRQGALNGAVRCVEEATHLAGWDRGLTGEMVTLAATRVRGAQSKPGEAVAQLTRSIVVAEEGGRVGTVLELRILRSLVLAQQGEQQDALVDLAHALTLAKPEGYVRIFLDEGLPVQSLLSQWVARAGDGSLRDYAAHLLSQFDDEPYQTAALQETAISSSTLPQSAEQALIEPLSERELEVLHLIALGKTNKAVAQQLFIAPGTVKAHTASIYRKLDVANRTEAVSRARQLGIL